MMSVKAVIWDIDGTLVDSEPLHLKALLAVCSQYGVDISDLPDSEFIGVNLHGVWERLQPRFREKTSRGEWIAAINGHYRSGVDTLQTIPDAFETMARLDRLGVRQAAVSNSGRVVVDANLASVGVSRFLEFSISLDDVSEGKPSPVPYNDALKRLDLNPNETIAVEDSLSGVRSAVAAGIPVAALMNPGLPATYVIKQLPDLLELVRPKYQVGEGL